MNQLGGLAGTAEAAHEILAAAMPLRGLHKAPPTSFAPPRSAKQRTVCALSGQLAGPDCSHTRAEIFLPGTEPWAPCAAHVRRTVDKRNGLLATASCPRAMVEERVFLRFDGDSSADEDGVVVHCQIFNDGHFRFDLCSADDGDCRSLRGLQRF